MGGAGYGTGGKRGVRTFLLFLVVLILELPFLLGLYLLLGLFLALPLCERSESSKVCESSVLVARSLTSARCARQGQQCYEPPAQRRVRAGCPGRGSARGTGGS